VLNEVLYDAAEAVRIAAVLLLPVMPASAAEILRRVGAPKSAADHRFAEDARWNAAGSRRTTKGEALWPRLARG
jgi:methionyl-tRNA synthetase